MKIKGSNNYNWNFVVNCTDSSANGFSRSLVSASTILPLFVSHLTQNTLIIGLLVAIINSFWLLPQIFAANFIERIDQKKKVITKYGIFLDRLPFFFMFISSLFARRYSTVALIIFAISIVWHGLGEGIIVVAWRSMLAKLFPVQRRGRFFGVSNALDSLFGVIGSGVATYVLSAFIYPKNFSFLFFFSF